MKEVHTFELANLMGEKCKHRSIVQISRKLPIPMVTLLLTSYGTDGLMPGKPIV